MILAQNNPIYLTTLLTIFSMQLTIRLRHLSVLMLALATSGLTTPVAAPDGEAALDPATYLVSPEQMLHWLENTDAELTFIGGPINPLAARSADNTMVTYCNRRIDDICGGSCTVYNGGAACLNAPDTTCLAATNNVGFCDRAGCGHSCNQLSTCGTRLENNFCYTPGTKSILVSSA